ncbi:hypothetical protein EWI07_13250 [Sporolactobacillus sp. THM7-4]|nr:hypothetical protein EWI07_13250 [Sporolactobacillus sp. THM7-4]
MSIYGRSNMGRLMVIGGLIGGCLSLLSRETRSVWGNRLSTAASNGGRLIYTIYKNPDQVGRYLKTTGTHLKTVAREVSQDFQQMIDHAEQARTSSTNAYQYVMEAGNEITEMAGKIRKTGQNMVRFQDPVLVGTVSESVPKIETISSVENTITNSAQKPMQSHKKNGKSVKNTSH